MCITESLCRAAEIGTTLSVNYCCRCSAAKLCLALVTPWTAARQASLSFTISGVCSDSCPSIWWCHPTISSSVTPFSYPQPFPASGSNPMNQLFASGGQGIGASASVFLMNIQGWFPLGLTGLISLLSKGLLRVFSSTTIWKHKFTT